MVESATIASPSLKAHKPRFPLAKGHTHTSLGQSAATPQVHSPINRWLKAKFIVTRGPKTHLTREFFPVASSSHRDNLLSAMSRQKDLAIESARVLREAGHVVYFAGGAVRDQLLGKEPKDYDLATSARPDQVQALFKKSDAVGEHFGVIIVKGTGEMIEVATFRTDGSYKDGRRPESVEFSSPEEDAQRRDFTINGLFQDPLTGEIIDHVGGKADLEARILRAIGEPAKAFRRGRPPPPPRRPLRRHHRLRNRTAQTWTAICECAPLLSQISPERIRDEFSRILVSDPTAPADLTSSSDSGLIAQFLPEVLDLQGCEQPPQWHPEGDVYVHTRIALSLLNYPPLNSRPRRPPARHRQTRHANVGR